MPNRGKRPCKRCSSPATNGRFCARHAGTVEAERPYDRWRGSPASRGYDADWRRVRLLALERDKHLCQACLERGDLTLATEVHHKIPIEIAPHLRLDLDNLASLCKPCHSAITATRDSSFARRKAMALLFAFWMLWAYGQHQSMANFHLSRLATAVACRSIR